MAKDKTMYVCSNCGQESAKWIGKCPQCGEWNTFKEIRVAPENNNSFVSALGRKSNGGHKPMLLKDISSQDEPRIDMGDEELNRVLGTRKGIYHTAWWRTGYWKKYIVITDRFTTETKNPICQR